MKVNLRRQKAINHLVEKGGSIASAMRLAGYSSKTARNPKKLTQTADFKPILELMKAERAAVFEEMQKKRKTARYADLGNILHKLNQDIRLVEGRPTQLISLDFDPEEEAKIEELLRSNC